jgi:hypothetical protein
MAGSPGQRTRDFFQTYIVGQRDLVLTLKSAAGASVNIDGPFDLKAFDWPTWRPAAGEPIETVIQPTTAVARPGAHETIVHVHVPWPDLAAGLWVRRHVIKMKLIDHERRISFYRDRPADEVRGNELFFFYARQGHLIDTHPVLGGQTRFGEGGDTWGNPLLLCEE